MGGNTILINNVPREIPASMTLYDTNSELRHVYAWWNGSSVSLISSNIQPTWNSAFGYWTATGDPSRSYLGSWLPLEAHTAPYALLRSCYNQNASYANSSALLSTAAISSSGIDRVTTKLISLPGDTLQINGDMEVTQTISSTTAFFATDLKVNGTAAYTRHNSVPDAGRYTTTVINFTIQRARTDTVGMPVFTLAVRASVANYGNVNASMLNVVSSRNL